MQSLTHGLVYKPVPRKARFVPILNISVPAGCPETLDGMFDDEIDLTDYLVKRPDSTYVIRVKGESMIEAGIRAGDLVVVDRAIRPNPKSIVVVMVDDEPTIKVLSKLNGYLWLVPSNKNLSPSKIKDDQRCEVWGVVTAVIHKFR